MTPTNPRPDVTVVVIVYNAGDHIEAAVQSVLDQSLRSREVVVVDDHSTDHTPEVMKRLVDQHPDDIRYFRFPANSGFPGGPRNEGIRQARGRFVTFLDGDDTLDRHACRNMLAMAEESGADMVVGRTVRHDVETGKEHSWMPWLVKSKAVYESLHDQPELLYDVISTNKLYRQDFLLRENLVFLEDRYYEDNEFAAHAYLTAKKIAIIPHRVYTWNVQRRGTQLSISNRPRDVRNLTDRVAVTRQIDALLDLHGTPELRLLKDVRFIENDLRTHLARIGGLPEATQRQMLDIAGPYVRDIDPEAFRQAKSMPAIAAYLIRMDDLEGAVAAYEYMVSRDHRAYLSAHLTVRDGRIYWCDRHLDDPLGREVLDVTELGFQDLPLADLNLGSRITEVRRDGDTVTLTGVVTNPLGRIAGTPKVSLVAAARRNRRRSSSTPATITSLGPELHWTATVSPDRAPRPIGFVDPVYSLALRVKTGGETFDLHLFAPDELLENLSLPVRPRLSRLVGDRMQAYRTDRGNVALRLAAEGRPARMGNAAITRLRSQGHGARAWKKAASVRRAVRSRLEQRTTKVAWYTKVFSRLPISRRTIVFESHMGKQFSDSPRAIYEELKRSGIRFRAVWVYAGQHPNGFPSDVKLVRRQSYAYLLALGRARYWVDNQGFPHDLRKRPGTTYIQTWHGSAYKRMGFDESNLKASSKQRQRKFQAAIDRFDAFLVRSEHDVRTLAHGLRVGAELLPVGYPRNDVLVTGAGQEEVDALRKSLGLTDSRRVVLYAPTFRQDEIAGGAPGLELPFSLDDFVERFSDRYVLLIRPHYLVKFALPPMYAHSVRNVANVHDVTPLMRLADALITDYSSLMFDYALLDRPMIFHAPDLEEYAGRTRGSYFDLAATVPGPLTRTSEELFGALADLDGNAAAFAERRRAFVEEFGEYDKGQAAKAVVDRFFRNGGTRG